MDNIIGTKIGIYDVINECVERDTDGHKLYHVQCIFCGYETDMRKFDIKRPQECNHIRKETDVFIEHSFNWHSKTLKSIFTLMKNRCYNQNSDDYRWYGNKGIKICDEWLLNPKAFNDWAIENGYKKGLSIDRKDEGKDYCPDNCHWITVSDNAKYKSTTHIIEVDGISHTGKDWSKVLNLGINTINRMFRQNNEELVKEFIRLRLKNPSMTRNSNQSWLNVYGLK